jgi:hypothetical protein
MALKCTAKELATALKAEPEDVWAWETGERFPTKRFVVKMQAMKKRGSVEREKKPSQTKTPASDPYERMADPELWSLLRKLVKHEKLLADVKKLADRYDDPADP